MAIVDASGDVENGYTYDVYGEPTVTGSLGNEFDFAGQQTDPSTGLQYLRARYYDPVSGTFMSREPLAVVPGWLGNPSGYAGANPARFADPSGLALIDSDTGGGCRGYGGCGVLDPNSDFPDGNIPRHEQGVCINDHFWQVDACRPFLPIASITQDALNFSKAAAGALMELSEYAVRRVLEDRCHSAGAAAPLCFIYHSTMKTCALSASCRGTLDSTISLGGTMDDIITILAAGDVAAAAVFRSSLRTVFKGSVAVAAFSIEWELYKYAYKP
jgi:RHS repeat-associated protein